MSTCPENDIHSIYLDGELPEKYVREFEAHVAQCSTCRARLEGMRKLKNAFASDCSSINLSEDFMDKSFERLQARLSYSKVSKFTKKFEPSGFKISVNGLRYIAVAAVAAALVAVVLPVKAMKSASEKSQFTPVARTSIQPTANSNVQIDQNVRGSALTSLLSGEESAAAGQNVVSGATVGYGSYISTPLAGYVFVPVQRVYAEDPALNSSLTGYDVFCPIPGENYYAVPAQDYNPSIRFNSSQARFSLETGSQK